ncbi:GNAT family N-acetyltransferase [Levilactobacillus tangyuanensis]|uniref:GNAT family N-acetyltransferase n=1 Tax=Levilactobacillus tangyuanensis TaxID=2486021 RepID=A0ABW1TM25_9LACO|nr:GNAT family N-acetyltransferase [Levilactobacillus tangyuanensis]
MLRLAAYQDDTRDRDRVANYPLKDATFTATPQMALTIAIGNTDRLPVMVLEDEELVGFLVLIKGDDVKEVGADPDVAILIRSVSVAENQRGKGYASRALQMLPEFVRRHFTFATTLVLSVDHGNLPAQKLYEKVGYVDTGRRGYGTYGEQYVLEQLI